MRIVWQDSLVPREYKPIKYRGVIIKGTPKGWIVELPNDDNLYKSHYCAQNAIDAALGGTAIRGRGTEKRLSYGIQIIGKRNDATG